MSTSSQESHSGRGRLSIVDLAGGRQPIANEDESIWVAFNGELFEYPELRQELLARPSARDPMRHRGLGPSLRRPRLGDVREGRGQFAVSLWDRNEPDADPRSRPRRHLPALLHRARRLAALGLGDQGPAGLGHGRGAGRMSEGIDHLFSFFCAGTTRTFFEGIKSIPPGHSSECPGRSARTHAVLGSRLSRRRADERRLDDPTPLVDELEAGSCGRRSSAGFEATCRS